MLLACGIDPQRHILFVQSPSGAHAQLAWIFNCVARLGWLNRMTQFKDKAGKDRENASAGLYVYPNLMAADILAYHATHVPVGDDQRQHLELANDIAQKFNHDCGADFFPQIEPLILGPAARVMSLRDGTQEDVEIRCVGSEPDQPERRRRHDRAEDPPREDRSGAAAVGAARAWRSGRRRATWSASTPPWPAPTMPACCASMAARDSARSRRRWRHCWWRGWRRSPRETGAAAGRSGADRRGAARRRRPGGGDRRSDRGGGGAAGRVFAAWAVGGRLPRCNHYPRNVSSN